MRPNNKASSRALSGLDPALFWIMALGGLLIFWGLGERDLWQDEAETALLGLNILKRGLPYAFDGVNFISAEAGREFGPDFLWRWSPWLQFYAAALGQSVLGKTAAACRLPFAFMGWLCLPLIYAVAGRLFSSLRVSRLSALLLALSTPFLLHVRQARWHAPAIFFGLCALWFLLSIERGKRRAALGFAISAAFLFYTNYFVAIGFIAALLAAAPILMRGREHHLALAGAALGAGALCLPGFWLYRILEKPAAAGLPLVFGHLAYYSVSFFTFLAPLPVLAILAWAAHDAGPLPLRRGALYLTAAALGFIAVLCLGPWRMFRYLAVLLPVAAIMVAVTVDCLIDRRPTLGWAVLGLVIFTNALHQIPFEILKARGSFTADDFPSLGPLRLPLLGFFYEITHPFSHCDRDLAAYLRAHAKPSDTVLATYGDLPLQFYTGLKVVGGFQGQALAVDPDWIVVRPYVVSSQPGKDYDVKRFISERIDPLRYVQVPLPCSDLILGQCPEPATHVFREPLNRPPAVLLRRL